MLNTIAMNRHVALKEDLRHRLAELKIYLPSDEEELNNILLTLSAYAKDGRIAEARKLTEE